MSRPPYLDPDLSADVRAGDLVGRMTLEEKVAQIGCVWSSKLLRDGAFDESAARREIARGIGHVTRIAGATVLAPRENARFANAIQRFLVEGTRLGIPALIHEESCAGFTSKDATCFPQAIGLAATFDVEGVEAMARAIRRQMLAVGARQTLAPVLDVARDPRWGRLEETFGEDPWLASRLGVAYVRGVQGGDLAHGVVATGKHFAGYAASEGGMNWAPAHLGPRTLREVHVTPFEAAIREAGLASVMNGYHELDGTPCGASRALLTDLLRGELGFDGVVVADYFTVDCLRGYHRIAADKAEAARRALEAGLDVELPALDCFGAPLREAVEAGRVDAALVDEAVRRLLRIKLRLGLFERPYVDADAAPLAFDTAQDRSLARELAVRSLVLLKNEGDALPLSPELARIAVVGPCADSIRVLQGDYHYPAHLEIVFGRIEEHAPAPAPGGRRGGAAKAVDLAEHFPPMTSILEGIRMAVSPDTAVTFDPGCEIDSDSTEGLSEAVSAARAADVAIVVVGGRSGLVEGCTSGESIDRCTLDLPGAQQQLVDAVLDTGTPTAVVLVDGRPLALPRLAERAPAVLHAWVPGQEGGHAVADVLFGRANPSGRLPVSLPRSVGQVPVFYGHKPSGGRSHWKGQYVDGETTPLFPFGHGLSYTRFEYGALAIENARPGAGESVAISVDVTNAGGRAGEEVAQLYVQDEVASVTRPVKELRGFARVLLAPGETKRVRFELAVSSMAFLDEAMRWIVEPGGVIVMLGASSEDLRAFGRFEIVGETRAIPPGARVLHTPVSVGPPA